MNTATETIDVAAVKIWEKSDTDHKFPFVYGNTRHADAWEDIHRDSAKHDFDRASAIEGFITSKSRFVDRYEAKKIALAANQLIVPESETLAALYSEDVW